MIGFHGFLFLSTRDTGVVLSLDPSHRNRDRLWCFKTPVGIQSSQGVPFFRDRPPPGKL